MRSASDITVRRRAAAELGALVLGAGLAACSDSEEPETAPPPRTTHGPTGSAAPAPPPTHPFTGERKGLNNPVLAVKIENTRPALPQSGVKAADIVSGVQSKMKKHVRNAPVYDISQENAGGAYFRSGSKPIPYNLYADPRDLLKRAPKAAKPRDIGFRFGEAPPGGKPTRSFTARWPSATMGFTWSKKQKRWLASFDGLPDRAAEGGRLGGETVVQTPTGRVALTIPPGTQNGLVFRLRGKGLPGSGPDSTPGDLLVTANIVLPTNLTDEEKRLFTQLKNLRQ